MVFKRRDYSLTSVKSCLLAASLVTASCTVGPDFTRPASPNVQTYTPNAEAEQTIKALQLGKDLPGQWWTLFHSKPLTALIEQAIKHNPNLQSAQATLVQAQENAMSKTGSLLPSIDATGYATRQQISGAQFGNPNFQGQARIFFGVKLTQITRTNHRAF